MLADILTPLATNAFETLTNDDRHHDERRDRIGPPPSDGRVEQQPGKKDRGKVCAQCRLCCICVQRSAADGGRDASFRPHEQRHHDERYGCNGDPDDALVGQLAADQRLPGIERDVSSEEEK